MKRATGVMKRAMRSAGATKTMKSAVKRAASPRVKSAMKRVASSSAPSGKRMPLPKRKADKTLVFADALDFMPNLTPEEVLKQGSFGGTYFRTIKSGVLKKTLDGKTVWAEFKKAGWLKGWSDEKVRNHTQRAWDQYDAKICKFGMKCGQTLEEWEAQAWIKAQDPYGWFQWYCRFYLGRRSPDDQRQIDRWRNCADVGRGRWRTNVVNQVTKAGGASKAQDPKVGAKIRQILHHFAFDVTKAAYEESKKAKA